MPIHHTVAALQLKFHYNDDDTSDENVDDDDLL